MSEPALGPSGSRVLVEENHDLPVARVTVTLARGGGQDAPGYEGLSHFACELARRGAGGRSRAELDTALEELGAELDVDVDHDSATFDLEVLSRNLQPALALLADILLRPDFGDAEAEQLRRESHANLDELRDDDSSLARRFYARQLFGDHPYGTVLSGTDASIDRFTADGTRGPSARDFFERALAGETTTFGLAGDLAPDAFRHLLAQHFSVMRRAGEVPPLPPAPQFASGLRLQIVDKPERTQSQILIGQPAPRWADADFLPLSVATTAFGGTFTARLMNEVRSKRGLSYGASARIGQAYGARSLTVTVFPSLDQTRETLELVLRLWREWVEGGVTDEEIAFAKNYMAASFASHVATPEDRLDLQLAVLTCGVRRDYAQTIVPRIRAVTPSEVRAAMSRHLRADDLAITVVSTAKPLLKKMKGSPILDDADVKVVPFDSY